MHDRVQLKHRRSVVVLSIAAPILFLVLVLLGNAATGVRFYVPSPADEPVGWAWRLSALLFVGALLSLGWTLFSPWARTAGWVARVAGISLAAAPATFLLATLAWSDDAIAQELVAMRVFYAVTLVASAVGIAGIAIASQRSARAAT